VARSHSQQDLFILFYRTNVKITRKIHVDLLKVFHRTERPVAVTTPHTDAHNTKHKASKWVIVKLSKLKSTVSRDLLKQSNEDTAVYVVSTRKNRYLAQQFEQLVGSFKQEAKLSLG